MDVDDRLQRVFRDVFDDDTLVLHSATGPTEVKGWDSLGTVSLLYAVEAEFGVVIDDDDVMSLVDVGALRDYLLRHSAL